MQGRRVKSPFLIRLGGVLIALWMVPVLMSYLGLAPVVYRNTPTFILIQWTKTTASYSSKLLPRFTELTTRPLSPEQTHALAHHMLNRRLREGNSPFSAAPWLDTLVNTPGGLPEALRERYFIDKFSPRLVIRETVVAGEPVVVAVTGTYRGTFHTLWPWARIDAIAIDGIELQTAVPTDWTYGLYLDPARGPFTDPNSRLTLEVPWTPQQAGAHTIRVTVRLASTSQGTTPGALDDPATPIIWTRTVDFEETVTVRPAGSTQP